MKGCALIITNNIKCSRDLCKFQALDFLHWQGSIRSCHHVAIYRKYSIFMLKTSLTLFQTLAWHSSAKESKGKGMVHGVFYLDTTTVLFTWISLPTSVHYYTMSACYLNITSGYCSPPSIVMISSFVCWASSKILQPVVIHVDSCILNCISNMILLDPPCTEEHDRPGFAMSMKETIWITVFLPPFLLIIEKYKLYNTVN